MLFRCAAKLLKSVCLARPSSAHSKYALQEFLLCSYDRCHLLLLLMCVRVCVCVNVDVNAID